MENLSLDFDFFTKEDWKQQLEKDLRGTTFEDLQSKDRNALTIDPFYTKDDLPVNIQQLIQHQSWHNTGLIHLEAGEEATANTTALEDLKNGVDAIEWHINTDQPVQWQQLLKDIQLDIIHSIFILSEQEQSDSLHQYLAENNFKSLIGEAIFILNDAVNAQLLDGQSYSFKQNPQLYIAGQEYAHLGLNSTTQIAYILSNLQEQLHQAKENNFINELNSLHIGMAQSTAFFEEIAKMRALYLLLPLILKEYEINIPFYFHGETSLTYLTAEDNPNNILRNTIAAMASVIGGAHYLFIHPHKASHISPEVDARRIARNQQHLFKEESYLDKIGDAAYGAYTIEKRTDDIAKKAWEIFLDIENTGGINQAGARFKADVLKAQEDLKQAYESGDMVLIGYNKFPLEEDNIAPAFEARTFANGLKYFQLALKNN